MDRGILRKSNNHTSHSITFMRYMFVLVRFHAKRVIKIILLIKPKIREKFYVE